MATESDSCGCGTARARKSARLRSRRDDAFHVVPCPFSCSFGKASLFGHRSADHGRVNRGRTRYGRTRRPTVRKYFPEGQMVLGCLCVLLLLSGCGAPGPECGSPDARDSVLKTISDNSNNALVDFVARNSDTVAARVSNANTEAEKSAIWQQARQGAAYRLDDSIVMNSRDRTGRAVTCTALLSATVEESSAEKEVDFRVEQAADGKLSVTVKPFQF
jgi:hypothetical protein